MVGEVLVETKRVLPVVTNAGLEPAIVPVMKNAALEPVIVLVSKNVGLEVVIVPETAAVFVWIQIGAGRSCWNVVIIKVTPILTA